MKSTPAHNGESLFFFRNGIVISVWFLDITAGVLVKEKVQKFASVVCVQINVNIISSSTKSDFRVGDNTLNTHVKLAPESVGSSGGDDDEPGRASTAEEEEYEEEGSNKLHLPIPKVDMPHAEGDEQDSDEKKNNSSHGQPLG